MVSLNITKITGKHMNPNYYRVGPFDLLAHKLRNGRQLVFRKREPALKILRIITIKWKGGKN